MLKYVFFCLFGIQLCSQEIDAHGMVMEPVNRGSAWRKGFKTPVNYDDNQNYCGGFAVSVFPSQLFLINSLNLQQLFQKELGYNILFKIQ